MPFCDLNADIKPWLGIPVSNTDHDDILIVIRDAMEVAIIRYTETEFALTPVTNELHDATQSDTLVPEHSPIASVQQILFYTSTDGSTGELIDPSDYHVKENAITFQNIYTPFKRAT